MIIYKNKLAFSELIADGKIKLTENTELLCYPKPQGIICSVNTCPLTGTNTLFNNESEYLDSEFGKYLVEFGITGDFIIRSDINVRGISKWLNYNLINTPFYEWYDKITVSQLGINKNLKANSINVENINPIKIPYSRIYHRNNQMSRDDGYDGMIVEATDIDGETHSFYYVPTRYASGTIISIIREDGDVKRLVVSIEFNNKRHILLVDGFVPKVSSYLQRETIEIGQSVTVQYTSFNKGNRLVNFSSATIVNINNKGA